ncbi:MAG: alpha/beta hydrolase [Opitutaceae bacterium]|jgi:acetyl esterase/lipase|nr:alpha/beta hydrolase [Opitutaceae bacterium]
MFPILSRSLFLLFLAIAILPRIRGAEPAAGPGPTLANVQYGSHERQTLDFYQAKPDQTGKTGSGRTPLLFFIHGGGWMTGDKANPDFLARCLDAGISVVSINYRLIPDARAAGITPPVKACLDDAARALQFVRGKADEWRIDKERIGGCGGSAGGFTALWLAFHPDMAEPANPDPVARESTCLRCVLAFVPQTSLDPLQMRAWIPNNDYGHHAFGLGTMSEFLEKRDALLPWIRQLSPYSLASAGDPPVLLFYDNPPAIGQPYKDPPHSANFGAGLAEKLETAGIEHEINYNNDYPRMKWPDLFGFLAEKLQRR